MIFSFSWQCYFQNNISIMSNKEQIEFLMTKLKAYRSRLGGDKQQLLSPFQTAHQRFRKELFQYKNLYKNLQKYDGERNQDIIFEITMKTAHEEAQKQLREMQKELARLEKEGNPVDQRSKVKHARDVMNLVNQLAHNGKADDFHSKPGLHLDDLITHNQKGRAKSDDQLNDDDDDEIILEFNEEDKKIDQQLDELINDIELLGVKNKRMNDGIDELQKKQHRVKVEIDHANEDLDRKNAQLKELLQHFGKGTNCCMTLFLLLLLIGLIVVLINVALKLKK